MGMAESNHCAAAAMIGQDDLARSLLDAATARLPRAGGRATSGECITLENVVLILTLLGHDDRCAMLYPFTEADVATGQRYQTLSVAGLNPSLAAAIAAEAGELTEKAEEHFAAAARDANDLPFRLLQPSVLLWQGRARLRRDGAATQAEGRGMITAALEDFRQLGMEPQARLARRWLNDVP
jgi:hypothetical protein